MNANPVMQLPHALGSGALTLGAGALALGARGLGWAIARFLAAPIPSAGVLLMAGGTALAAANAVYFQPGPHPAPLFLAPGAASQPAPPPRVEPVVVEPAPAPRPAPLSTSSTQPIPAPSQPPAQETRPIGNAEIAELQRKLSELGLFDGTVDGFYGPKTADAIRSFESRFGLPRTGAASREVIEAVRRAPLERSQAPQPMPAPVAEARPASLPVPADRQAQAAAASIDSLIAEAATTGEPEPAVIAALVELDSPAAAPDADSPLSALIAMAQRHMEQPEAVPVPAARDRELVSTIQRGLATLGFLQGPVDGVAGESTARAIRNFEVFHSYQPTGEVRSELVELLAAAGADI